MGEETYLLSPEEAGVKLNQTANPTSTGWKVVTPESWHFRTQQIADKALTVEGYVDVDTYMDCTKAKIIAEVFEEDPMRRPSEVMALADERYLDSQHIVIRPNELFVGNWGNDEHAMLFDPLSHIFHYYVEFYENGKAYYWENGEKLPVSPEINSKITAFSKRWNIVFGLKPLLSETAYKMHFEVGQRFWEPVATTGARANPDHDWYLKIGLKGLITRMVKTIERLEKESEEVVGPKYVDLRKRINDCKSSIRATEAVSRWIKRHGKVAGEMAGKTTDPKDKERLGNIAAACEWVAENPPRTFWEVMQLHWLSFMAHSLIEMLCHSIAFRPDQTFWDWYKKDVIEEKTLSRTRAAELFACYCFKYHEIGFLCSLEEFKKSGMGARDSSVLTIGGQKADGSDASNELTMLILDVMDGYRLHFPDVKLRWHDKLDKKVLRRAAEVMRTGMGLPSIKNDNVAIRSMLSLYGNTSIEEARSWAVVGCNTPGVTINSRGPSRRAGKTLNAFKTLELALFNGTDPEPGYEWVKGIKTGDPAQFKDFEELYQAWLKQWKWLVNLGMNIRNTADKYWMDSLRRPFISMLYKRCVEEGRDIQTLDVPQLTFWDCPGLVDTIDSLAAVKYWVYDKKKYTMKQLLEALKAEWEGYEEMRQDFKDAPKFGNNEDYVDNIFTRATIDISEIGKKILDFRNDPAGAMNALVVTWMYHLAPYTGAMPNGRKRGEALCDGGINPHAEFDNAGPWARMASALKVDQSRFRAWIYNQKIDYSSVKGDAGLDKLVSFLEGGLEGGMDQIQCNFVSKEILKDAKKHPEKHPLLSVRISGYSAFFVPLPEHVQDAVIDRRDQEL